MDFMMSCDGMKPPITSGGGGGGLQWPNKTLSGVFGIFNAAGSYQNNEPAPPYAHGDSHRPHCKSVTVAQLPGQRVHGSSPHCTRRVSGRDFDTLHANRCTQVTNGDSLEVYGAAGSEISRFR